VSESSNGLNNKTRLITQTGSIYVYIRQYIFTSPERKYKNDDVYLYFSLGCKSKIYFEMLKIKYQKLKLILQIKQKS